MPSTATLLSAAISKFNESNYSQALDLFTKAGAVYGNKFVQANISLCKRRLNINDSQADVSHRNVDNLDPATQLMMANAGKIELSDNERNDLITLYKSNTNAKSSDAAIKNVSLIPKDWPANLELKSLPISTNDFIWLKNHQKINRSIPPKDVGISVVVPTFNRSHILQITLAALTVQVTKYKFEVIVADDGSSESIVEVAKQFESKLDIKYVRQKDYGYQLCAVRNLGMRTAKYDFIAILDCDMAPAPNWIDSYLNLLLSDDRVALVGPRKYIDTSIISPLDILADSNLLQNQPEVITNNSVAGKMGNAISVDWRLEYFKDSNNLLKSDEPFRYFSGGNVAFAKYWLDKAGWFDEEFNHWGGEDNEFAYRLYRAGCFFQYVPSALAYHQEPPGKENETDRDQGRKITMELVNEKVPYFYRKITPIQNSKLFKAPLVSIYIPTFNSEKTIVKCVESALNQTITDLEVCICDDGSTDKTKDILNERYLNHPRVRYIRTTNGGIASASNKALKMVRGFYVGQLDSDDYLEPDAVETCLNEFLKNRKLTCVYTTNRNIDDVTKVKTDGYNWPIFSREKLTTAMIVHHFRMFTIRSWNLTTGFDETLENAVDYDMYLKLSEVGPFKHINKICYNRVLHGNNTSIKKLSAQKTNHYLAINKSLERQQIKYNVMPRTTDRADSRDYNFIARDAS